MNRLTLRFALITLLLLIARPAVAGLTDFKPNTPGVQSASWPPGSTIMIFMDGVMGDSRKCFEMGVKSWDDVLANITVQFKDGDRPAGAGGIQVSTVAAGSLGGEFGQTSAAPFFPAGSNTGTLDSANIKIDISVLGNCNFLKNLGTHEFGHALGFDDDPRASGVRVNVMDPDFDENSQVITPSARDKATAAINYKLVPLPPAVWSGLGLMAAMGLVACRRMLMCRHPA